MLLKLLIAHIDQSRKILEANGFALLSEKDDFSKTVKAGGKYFFTRNQSSIIAFAVGKKYVRTFASGYRLMAYRNLEMGLTL